MFPLYIPVLLVHVGPQKSTGIPREGHNGLDDDCYSMLLDKASGEHRPFAVAVGSSVVLRWGNQ